MADGLIDYSFERAAKGAEQLVLGAPRSGIQVLHRRPGFHTLVDGDMHMLGLAQEDILDARDAGTHPFITLQELIRPYNDVFGVSSRYDVMLAEEYVPTKGPIFVPGNVSYLSAVFFPIPVRGDEVAASRRIKDGLVTIFNNAPNFSGILVPYLYEKTVKQTDIEPDVEVVEEIKEERVRYVALSLKDMFLLHPYTESEIQMMTRSPKSHDAILKHVFQACAFLRGLENSFGRQTIVDAANRRSADERVDRRIRSVFASLVVGKPDSRENMRFFQGHTGGVSPAYLKSMTSRQRSNKVEKPRRTSGRV